MKTKPRTISFLVCLIVAFILTAWVAVELYLHSTDGGPQFGALLISGYSALVILGLSLLAHPLARVSRRVGFSKKLPLILAFRRSLGLTASWMATVHFLIVVTRYLHGQWEALFRNLFLNAGLLAYALLLSLTVSSFPALNRFFAIRMWTELHRLVYAIAVVAVFHVGLSAFIPTWAANLAFISVALLLAIRLLPRTNHRRSQ